MEKSKSILLSRIRAESRGALQHDPAVEFAPASRFNLLFNYLGAGNALLNPPTLSPKGLEPGHPRRTSRSSDVIMAVPHARRYIQRAGERTEFPRLRTKFQ